MILYYPETNKSEAAKLYLALLEFMVEEWMEQDGPIDPKTKKLVYKIEEHIKEIKEKHPKIGLENYLRFFKNAYGV